MEKYENAAKGLKQMFTAEVGAIICTVVMIIPIVGTIIGGIGVIVFAILSLIGLSKAGKDIEGCKKAFTFTIIGIVVNVFTSLLSNVAVIGTLCSVAGEILNLVVVYFVCTSVSETMKTIGANDVANTGMNVWKINLICYIAAIVIGILAALPVDAIVVIAGVLAIVVAIVELVAQIMYMIFLNKSAKALNN